MNDRITFTATGDSFITRRLPAKDKAFQELSSIIQKGEVRFTNLEVTTHNYEGFPSAFSGGTWAIAPPDVLSDMKDYGFNMMAWANNHTMDYSYGGLEATGKYLNQYGFVHAGVGKNLSHAAAPRYLECPSGRVALIAVTSSFHESWIAGEQRRDMEGRPGINPLRYTATHYVSREKINQLKAIAKTVDINAELDLSRKEGFAVKEADGVFQFGQYRFTEGNEEGVKTCPLEKDIQRTNRAIEEAKRQADHVIVSVHSHQFKGLDKELPADFLSIFAKQCIDAGAHAVIGHGPHILRGIEIYKKRPIFYSLGNFIFQSETVESLPADFYEKYGLGHTDNVADALDKRTDGDTRGLGADQKVWESVVAYWSMEKGELKELKLYPIQLGYGMKRFKRGWPVLSDSMNTLHRLQQLSEPMGTRISIEGLVGTVELG